MFASEIKKYITDNNARANPNAVHHQRQSSQPVTNSSGQQLNAVKIASIPLASHGKVAVVGSSSSAQRENGAERPGPDINELMARQAQPRGQTAGAPNRNNAGTAKINLEAYEAYHNSKDNALLLSQTQSEELAQKNE